MASDWVLNVGLNEANLKQNGWHKFPSGLIVQWGSGLGVLADEVIYYPIPFPNLFFIGLASYSSINDFGAGVSFEHYDKHRFRLGVRNIDRKLKDSKAFWVALGY